METGNVLVRLAQAELLDDVVPHAAGRARGERCKWTLWEMRTQPLQQAVIRTEFMSPLRDAVGFVDGEERDRHALEPAKRVRTRQPLGGEIQQAILAPRCLRHDLSLR